MPTGHPGLGKGTYIYAKQLFSLTRRAHATHPAPGLAVLSTASRRWPLAHATSLYQSAALRAGGASVSQPASPSSVTVPQQAARVSRRRVRVFWWDRFLRELAGSKGVGTCHFDKYGPTALRSHQQGLSS